MESPDIRIKRLFRVYLDNQMSPEEYREFWLLLETESRENGLSGDLERLWDTAKTKPYNLPDEIWDQNMAELRKQVGQPVKVIFMKRFRKLYRMTAAAIVIILLSAGIYFYLAGRNTQQQIAVVGVQAVKKDVFPGTNKAVLTLANGSSIILNDAENGVLTEQGNTQVQKVEAGQLVYNASDIKSKEILYNRISTPRSGQYQVVLPDGTKVFLNSASSIRFPTAFIGKKREVDISGEVYFEVAKNAAMPFKVNINGGEAAVEVLGTHFNVNAYADEAVVKTTLLEGAVKVTKGNATGLLKPGQQAQFDKKDKIEIINDADIELAVAWKNGFFLLKNADIPSMMRQISRWYDVDIVYKGKIPDRKFGCSISRTVNLSNMLQALEASNVHCKVEGRKLIVLP
jgi:transmembrane sensor